MFRLLYCLPTTIILVSMFPFRIIYGILDCLLYLCYRKDKKWLLSKMMKKLVLVYTSAFKFKENSVQASEQEKENIGNTSELKPIRSI